MNLATFPCERIEHISGELVCSWPPTEGGIARFPTSHPTTSPFFEQVVNVSFSRWRMLRG